MSIPSTYDNQGRIDELEERIDGLECAINNIHNLISKLVDLAELNKNVVSDLIDSMIRSIETIEND